MTTKEWLDKGRKLDKEINEMIEMRDKAFYSACGSVKAADGEKVQTSRRNSTEEKFAEYAQCTAIIDKRIDELYQYRQKMLEKIKRVDNSEYRALLIARYINCKTWEKVAEDMHYMVRNIYNLHEQALKALSLVIGINEIP